MQAVQYSVPARYTVQIKLRRAFRSIPALPDAHILNNTYTFLKLAVLESKLEHKIVRNLCFVEWSQRQKTSRPTKAKKDRDAVIDDETYKAYQHTLDELNKSFQVMLV
ncbi:hypothetical protein BCR37DRAFT_393900 [Protomyces lactucae-debilis]|uniref:Uncharacterized protein n=1 Tax=Protomyces lactucae-debilis TaxID=2754530 RepID=A0A1Y2F8Z8_PROLT|nr:uncharacterized protein BCR37DRAFT_393900 [Protomyces lactucae-debilis]ORY79816.1 hypothetical protein BCR37DRAFT_393900 [Protomyces lactucae-debilis]